MLNIIFAIIAIPFMPVFMYGQVGDFASQNKAAVSDPPSLEEGRVLGEKKEKDDFKWFAKAKIDGDVVECGVWKGGSAMLIGMTLLKFNCADKKIYLYDTYEGMTEPADVDVNTKGEKAGNFFDKVKKGDGSDWCYSAVEEVKKNMLSTGYPEQNIFFVKGKVQNTIPSKLPENICLLRLDTDWYDSTYHEMKFLYPLFFAGFPVQMELKLTIIMITHSQKIGKNGRYPC